MNNSIKKMLSTYCELHWWNMGTKTLSYKGDLNGLLLSQKITFTKRKTEYEGIFVFTFRNSYGIRFSTKSTLWEFTHYAKQMVQMELVRMGDKSQLYVADCWRSTVTVNK